MKFTFISRNGDILPLAQKVEEEGNQVTFFLVGDNDDYVTDRNIIDVGSDVVVIDSPGFGRLSAKLKKLGFPVIGGSLLSDTINNNSNYHSTFLKACGLYTNGMEMPIGHIPIEIEGWFNGKDFTAIIYTVNSITFTGTKSDKLYSECLSRMVTPLRRNNYVGPISIKANINKDYTQYEEVKAQFTLPTMLVLMEGVKNGVSNILNGIANGSNRWMMFKPGFFIAIQLIISPNSVLDNEMYSDIPIEGLMKENLKHIWAYGINRDGESYYYSGNNGRFGVVTSRGDTISEARRRANRTIEGKTIIDPSNGRKSIKGGIKVDNMMYLKGVGNKADYQYNRLKEWKWLA